MAALCIEIVPTRSRIGCGGWHNGKNFKGSAWLTGASPDQSRTENQGYPRQERPGGPDRAQSIRRNAEIPMDGVGNGGIKNEEKNGCGAGKKGKKDWRNKQEKRRQPDKILGGDAGGKNEKDQPAHCQSHDQATGIAVASSPRQEQNGTNNDEFEEITDNDGRWGQSKKTNPIKLLKLDRADEISEPPKTPISSVGKNILDVSAR